MSSRPFRCDTCGSRFSRREHLRRHIDTVHLGRKEYSCEICSRNFSRKDNLQQHMEAVHGIRRRRLSSPAGREEADGLQTSSSVPVEVSQSDGLCAFVTDDVANPSLPSKAGSSTATAPPQEAAASQPLVPSPPALSFDAAVTALLAAAEDGASSSSDEEVENGASAPKRARIVHGVGEDFEPGNIEDPQYIFDQAVRLGRYALATVVEPPPATAYPRGSSPSAAAGVPTVFVDRERLPDTTASTLLSIINRERNEQILEDILESGRWSEMELRFALLYELQTLKAELDKNIARCNNLDAVQNSGWRAEGFLFNSHNNMDGKEAVVAAMYHWNWARLLQMYKKSLVESILTAKSAVAKLELLNAQAERARENARQ